MYPLDMLGHWHRGYRRRGFTQYQFVIPFGAGVRRMREDAVELARAVP